MKTNRHGRPWGVPREHVNRWGREKDNLTETEAVTRAIEMNIDRWESGKQRRGLVAAYDCAYCGHWHVGTMSKQRPYLMALQLELGRRAYSNFSAENFQSRADRYRAIVSRWRRYCNGYWTMSQAPSTVNNSMAEKISKG